MANKKSPLGGETTKKTENFVPNSPPWKPLSERKSDRENKRLAVLNTASQMFLERGSHRVNLNEIAERLNITKPALYNYFKSKAELLTECFRQANAITRDNLDEVDRKGGDGLEKLRNFITSYARLITLDYGSVMVRLDDKELPAKERAEVRRYKREIDARIRSFIQEGIADGSIVPCDVRLTTFSILGALNWIGQWYHENGPNTPEEIGNEFAERLTNGLAAHKGDSTRTP